MKIEIQNVWLFIVAWVFLVFCGLIVCIFSGKIADMATLRYVAVILMLIGALVSAVVVGIERIVAHYRTTDYSAIDETIDYIARRR